MADIYGITAGQDRIVTRDHRISYNVLSMKATDVKTEVSKFLAPNGMRITFRLAAYSYQTEVMEQPITLGYGHVMSLNPMQFFVLDTPFGPVKVQYVCSGKLPTNGEYTWGLTIENQSDDNTITFYMEDVFFEEAFGDPSKGWLLSTDTDNVLGDIINHGKIQSFFAGVEIEQSLDDVNGYFMEDIVEFKHISGTFTAGQYTTSDLLITHNDKNVNEYYETVLRLITNYEPGDNEVAFPLNKDLLIGGSTLPIIAVIRKAHLVSGGTTLDILHMNETLLPKAADFAISIRQLSKIGL